MDLSNIQPGVIWISGYSSSGKSTVAREIVLRLKMHAVPAILLDGDNLRNILHGRWGYSHEERIELSRVYFQLSSYLASQGSTVVIAAIALYDETRDWIEENIPNSLSVFLNVPEDERLRRDTRTKSVYQKIAAADPGYSTPHPDRFLIIDNFNGTQPGTVAQRIIDAYKQNRSAESSFGKHEHWETTYRQATGELSPSPFAIWVAETQLDKPARILEVGCGNGRDAAYLAARGHNLLAIDTSAAAIELCRSLHRNGELSFRVATADAVDAGGTVPFDAIYSRFVLHAMTGPEEEVFVNAAHRLLRNGGRLMVECRSINDPLALIGEAISPTERIHGHYRRFIVSEQLLSRLSQRGFRVELAVESKGLAVYNDEDPVVIRIVARKG